MPSALPPPPTASSSGGGSKGGTPSKFQALQNLYERSKKRTDKVKQRAVATTGAVVATAEMQGTLALTSFASGFMRSRGKSLEVYGVDVRPVIGGLGGLASLLLDDEVNSHGLAVSNGILGSFIAEKAFDFGVQAGVKGAAALEAAQNTQGSTQVVTTAAPPAAPPAATPVSGVRYIAADDLAGWEDADVEGEIAADIEQEVADELAADLAELDNEVGMVGAIIRLTAKQRMSWHLKKMNDKLVKYERGGRNHPRGARQLGSAMAHYRKASAIADKKGWSKPPMPAILKGKFGSAKAKKAQGGGPDLEEARDRQQARLRLQHGGPLRRVLRRPRVQVIEEEEEYESPGFDHDADDILEELENMSDEEYDELSGSEEEETDLGSDLDDPEIDDEEGDEDEDEEEEIDIEGEEDDE